MPRVTRGFKARRRRNKVLKLAKGFRGGRSRLYRTATEAVDRALFMPSGTDEPKNVISVVCGSPVSMPVPT